ncbi:T3SS effector NleG family protein [Escherichia coli]|uniref:T3SS effector NleG family protein n=1 Tax=Escherichia coli TaxID=562 RepID=UPI0006A2431C|nr:T3SS effector NleG family protein [Escherichia coli]EFD0843057.1 DUF1076 domain-containing protein [Escherichia coli]EFG1372649.1 DUF1076 domain-containing protein [Escherichia coli]EFG6453508.1 DUF1076 domain-containing protein [Escherichia coli]EFK4035059.1 DUF1076 domain-containing protein [Escherichia coli]EGE3936004.1 DUF1076 domain-containing protein [Escherichia coli]
MPVILNFSNGSTLTPREVDAVRHVARHNNPETIIAGERHLRVHHIPGLDGFQVEAIPGSLLDRFGDRRRTHRELALALETQLNGGRTFLQAVSAYIAEARANPQVPERPEHPMYSRISSCSFTVNPDDLKCGELHLTCPITLCVPGKGIFVRNASDSDICSLYDPDALKEMVHHNASHPFSREPLTPRMIVHKNDCYFNEEKQQFCVKSSSGEDTFL